MADEASKTNRLRGPEFLERFLSGTVLDIGCGNDLVVPHAEPYDRLYGHPDAGAILSCREPESYRTVHSSHALEHMDDAPSALAQWWALVEAGGYLVLVVPEEDLYEQGFWPSRFNSGHRCTFRLRRETSWSPVSYDLGRLVRELPGAEVVAEEVQADGYVRFLRSRGRVPRGRVRAELNRLRARVVRWLGLRDSLVDFASERLLGFPVDQTRGGAVAQIQVVVRKREGG